MSSSLDAIFAPTNRCRRRAPGVTKAPLDCGDKREHKHCARRIGGPFPFGTIYRIMIDKDVV
jgi:hypothetical protein